MLWLRPAVVAGRFYPAEKFKLLSLLKDFCPPHEKKYVTAVMAPHAGYVYSGKFAGDAYQRVAVPENVIILCPNHTGRGPRISIWSEGCWDTPLGRVPVAEDVASELMRLLGIKDGDMLAHMGEHAIEVHLPFLQYQRKNLRIVPIVLGPTRFDQCEVLATALATVLKKYGKEKCLLVASTDMSHFIPADVAAKLDALALEKVKALDAKGLYDTVCENGISMCGYIPTATVIDAAVRLGCKKAELISYGNSGEATGDMNSVVAYANAVID